MTHFTAADWAAITSHNDTVLGPPAAGTDLIAFERSIGVTLPHSHKDLLLRGNGGVIGYARLFGVNRPDAFDLGRQVNDFRPEFERTSAGPVLPFASDWGGSYFCYDLRTPGSDYPVLYWNHEYSEEPADRPFIWSRFADNFVAFVRRVTTQ